MLRKFSVLFLALAFIMGGFISPASASVTSNTGTATTSAKVLALSKNMAAEAKWSAYGCGLNKSVAAVLKVAKVGKAPAVAVAKAAVKAANSQGSGFCKAIGTIGKTVASMWANYYTYGGGLVGSQRTRG